MYDCLMRSEFYVNINKRFTEIISKVSEIKTEKEILIFGEKIFLISLKIFLVNFEWTLSP